MEFAEKIKELCTKRRISTAQLAAILEVTEESVEAWDSGRRMPSLKILPKIALALDTSVDYLISSEQAQIQKVLFGAPNSHSAYGRVTQKGVIDQLNEDYLPYGWHVTSTQLFANGTGEDQIFVVIEK